MEGKYEWQVALKLQSKMSLEERNFLKDELERLDGIELMLLKSSLLVRDGGTEEAAGGDVGQQKKTSGQKLHDVCSAFEELKVKDCVTTPPSARIRALDPRYSLVNQLEKIGLVKKLYLHDASKPSLGVFLWLLNPFASIDSSICKIRDYYGEQVAVYWIFMYSYLTWLIPLSLLGAIFWYACPSKEVESIYMPIWSGIVCLWCFLMLKSLSREENRFAFKFGTFFTKEDNELQLVHPRPQFYGYTRQSKITGKDELYYPSYKRYLKYVVSFLVSLCGLFIALVLVICSLNCSGDFYDKTSPCFIEFLSQFSQPGRVFDPQGTISWMWPIVIYSWVIGHVNEIYSRIAYKLTYWENHKNDEAFKNALIIKRFLFCAVDTHLPLFYVLLYQKSMVNLKSQLIGLFLNDEIRRVTFESILPLISGRWEVWEMMRDSGEDFERKVEVQSKLDKHCEFDDYSEMVTQFGYIALFPSAFLLAPLMAVISNSVEMFSDAFRITWLNQRPKSYRVRNMGSWKLCLHSTAWFAILTNCWIFCMCSEQMPL